MTRKDFLKIEQNFRETPELEQKLRLYFKMVDLAETLEKISGLKKETTLDFLLKRITGR